MQCLREGVVSSDLVCSQVDEDDAAAVAGLYVPPGRGIAVLREAGEEEIGAADGGGEVRVGAAAERDEGIATAGVDEESEELGRVERAEAAAEGGGRTDGVEEGAAGEGGADEAREGRKEEEDLAEEVVSDGGNCGGGRCRAFRRRR